MSSKPRVVLMTDFGVDNMGTAAMEGVISTIDNELICTNLTHRIAPFNTWQASGALMYVVPFWPAGTVFVSVVDPGVGTHRRASVAKLKNGCYVVTPDNGTLTHMYYKVGIEAIREIDENVNRLKGTEGTSIFHGRDLFGYTAARLASGIIDFEGVGPEYPVEEIVEHPIYEPDVQPGCVKGYFEINDPNFGNLWTNIPLDAFKGAGFQYGDMVNVSICHEGKEVFHQRVLFHQSFGFAQKGDPMIYNNELMKVAMAVSQGSMCKKYDLWYGPEWTVVFTK